MWMHAFASRWWRLFPGKEILIGETGWPSHGLDARRLRWLSPRQSGAFHFRRDSSSGRGQDNFRVNFFEAYATSRGSVSLKRDGGRLFGGGRSTGPNAS